MDLLRGVGAQSATSESAATSSSSSTSTSTTASTTVTDKKSLPDDYIDYLKNSFETYYTDCSLHLDFMFEEQVPEQKSFGALRMKANKTHRTVTSAFPSHSFLASSRVIGVQSKFMKSNRFVQLPNGDFFFLFEIDQPIELHSTCINTRLALRVIVTPVSMFQQQNLSGKREQAVQWEKRGIVNTGFFVFSFLLHRI
jgi:hypothetical protein